MPRTSSKSKNTSGDLTGRTEKNPFWKSLKAFLTSRQARMIFGVLLFLFSVIALLSFFSYLFTGAADQSVLDQSRGEQWASRGEVHNLLGLPGARLSHFFIEGSFGFVSLVLIVMLGLYALRIIHIMKNLRSMRLFCRGSFWILWGATVLGFAQHTIGKSGSFHWGGRFGEAASQWLQSYVHFIGTSLILAALLVIFLILTDPHFIDRCKRFGAWMVAKIKAIHEKRKTKKENEEEEPVVPAFADGPEYPEVPLINEPSETPEEESPSEDVVIDIPIPDEPEEPKIEVEQIDVPLTIEETLKEEEPVVEEPVEEEPLPDDGGPTDGTLTDLMIQESKNEVQKGQDGTELEITETKDDELYEKDPDKLLEKLGPYDPQKDLEFFKFPSMNMLKVYDNETAPVIDENEQRNNGARIVTTLRNYGIEIESIKATVGPTVTLYEIVPKAGIRVSQVQRLESDIMMSLSATGIRIIAPMPGKGTIGIEVPNEKPQVVSMHSVIASKRFQDEQKMKLPIAYGRTITNEVFMFDLAKTPHLLVAGATGTGKSVAINAIITSLLYKKHPAELKLVMVDPKMVEFAPYKPLLKHYLAAMPDTDPEQIVITDCDRVINTLNSLVIEMENRYKLLMDAGVRNLEDYNDKFVRRRLNPNKLVADSLHHQYLPYIVIIIDEYGDFIMQAGKQVETPIARITQKARAVGMHMILATQRPSVNIVTGVIKANIPTRIALRTQSVIDSRTVLDAKGAEQLIGRGDSLYAGNASITRVQCAFVDTPEVDAIVAHIAKQQKFREPYQLPEYVGEGAEEALAPGSVDMKRLDPMFADVARYVVTKQEGSTSRLQRAFEIGYNRAGKLSDQLEAAGIVGPNKGPKGRDVLIQDLSQLDKLLEELGVA
jgi:S-DNA-T family DNA segregation ATPase FtsK/SpoIIIE